MRSSFSIFTSWKTWLVFCCLVWSPFCAVIAARDEATSSETINNRNSEKSEPQQQDPPEDRIRQENGIFVIQSAREMKQIFQSKILDSHDTVNNVSVLAALIYTEQCASNDEHVRSLEESISALENPNDLLIGKMHLSHFIPIQQDQQQGEPDQGKELIVIEGVPAIAIYVHDSRGKIRLWTVWETGSAEDLILPKMDQGPDLPGLYWHYYSRLVLASDQVLFLLDEAPRVNQNQVERVLSVTPKRFFSHPEARLFVCGYMEHPKDRRLRNAHPLLPRGVKNGSKEWQRFLLDYDLVPQNEFVVFVQCRGQLGRGEGNNSKVYSMFQRLYETMIHRPDVLYLTLHPKKSFTALNDYCQQDGSIMVWRFAKPTDQTCQKLAVHTWLPWQENTTNTVQQEIDLIRFHRAHATPNLLLFDRLVAAPLLLDGAVNALLFVNVHPSLEQEGEQEVMAKLIRHFGKYCKQTRRERPDLTCALVPSTETRLLTTLGVDIWSPLDQKLLEYSTQNMWKDRDYVPDLPPPVLPQLVLLDRRHGGVRLYRLEPPLTDEAITDFFYQFWSNRLHAELKSSFSFGNTDRLNNPQHHRNKVNDFGIQKLTAHEWSDLFAGTNGLKHKVILFLSPSCGHCKRILALCNKLADFLLNKAPSGWNNILTFYIVDVSTDEMPSRDIAIWWLPDLVCVLPSTTPGPQIIQYNQPNQLKVLGNVNHHTELLEWLIQVMDFGLGEERQWNSLLLELQQYSVKASH